MALNKRKGNMYPFITHTWNPIKGECFHNCTYCYMKEIFKRFPKLQSYTSFSEKEMRTNLGKNNFIFVGSSNDIFSQNIKDEWIKKILHHCSNASHFENKFFFNSKNPGRVKDFKEDFPENSIFCLTIESNRDYPEIYGYAPKPYVRFQSMLYFFPEKLQKMLTIEPILDFDLEEFSWMIENIKPVQVNIGADTGNNNLPEPSKEKITGLIKKLEDFKIKVVLKPNLKRLLK